VVWKNRETRRGDKAKEFISKRIKEYLGKEGISQRESRGSQE